MTKKVPKKILSFCYDIKQYADKRRSNHKKIGYGLIGEHALKSFNKKELGMLIEAFCMVCNVRKPKDWMLNNHIEYIKEQPIW